MGLSPADRPPDPSALLVERLARRIKEHDRTIVPFLPWNERIKTAKGPLLDFHRYPFQRELYSDEVTYAREVVEVKATQVGSSERAVRWGLFFADTRGWTGIYAFPKAKHLRAFADTRVKPLVQSNEYLRVRVPPGYIDNKELKQIGRGFLHFRGAQNVDELDNVDADHLILDEYDRIPQRHIPDAEQRLSGSDHALLRRIGNPSIPGFGIDRLYQASDQREWMVKCGRCKAGWQEIDFWKNVDQKTATIVCSHCRKPLDVREGEWVARVTEGDRPRGYHMSRLIVPVRKLNHLVEVIAHSKQRKPFEVQRFFNKDLGLAYADAKYRLSDAAILANQSQGGGYGMPGSYEGLNPVTMGVDVASERSLNVKISEHLGGDRKRTLWLGEVDDPNPEGLISKLGDLMSRYQVNMAAIDHLPDGRIARAFAARWPGRVYVVALSDMPRGDAIRIYREQANATVDRTRAIDAVISMFRSQLNWLPGSDLDDLPEGYVDHLKAPVRFHEQDEKGEGKVKVGYRSSGPDDYMMAEVFDVVAGELFEAERQVQQHFREEISTLDDHVQFERTDLTSRDDEETPYFAGPDEDDDWDSEEMQYGADDWPVY